MRVVSLVSYVLLPILVILLLSITAQATEYRENNTEVKASDISKHIENGDDIYLYNCRIVGELNVSKLQLKTVHDPYYDKLGEERYYKERRVTYAPNQTFYFIKGNIIITNSTFENDLNFSGILFNNSVSFYKTHFHKVSFSDAYFYNTSDFSSAYFDNYVDFDNALFEGNADFSNAYFDNYVNFFFAFFQGEAEFSQAFFKNYASFSVVKFMNNTDFSNADFYNITSFSDAYFNKSAYFSGAIFNDQAYFTDVIFVSYDYFEAPATSETIITNDIATCELFRSYYKSQYRLIDANNIYVNYRNECLAGKSWTDISKVSDCIEFLTCGYGTNPLYTLRVVLILIIAFAYIYRPHTTVSVVKSKYELSSAKVYWKDSGIYTLADTSEKKSILSFWDALYFSVNTFANLGSTNCHPRENFIKWVTLERLLGWILLAIFLSITTSYLIKL